MKAFLTTILMISYLNFFAQDIIQLEMQSLKFKPIIEAEINGIKAYFLVDTGSDISILNRAVLKSYQAREIYLKNRKKRAVGFNGAIVHVNRVQEAHLKLGENFGHNTFYSMDLGDLSKAIQKKTSFLISGIIGADILIKYNCIIDYERRQLTFSSKRFNEHMALTE